MTENVTRQQPKFFHFATFNVTSTNVEFRHVTRLLNCYDDKRAYDSNTIEI